MTGFSLYLSEKLQLSDEELVGSSLLIIFGGFETTATTLEFTLTELARNQDIQVLSRFSFWNYNIKSVQEIYVPVLNMCLLFEII